MAVVVDTASVPASERAAYWARASDDLFFPLEVTHGTAKGSVTHMKVPTAWVQRMDEPALPCWLVFPRYVADAPPQLVPRDKASSAMELARNAFNYVLLGRDGFEALADVVEACACYDFSYSRLEDAAEVFDGLSRQTAAAGDAP